MGRSNNNEWVYVCGVKESPNKGGIGPGPKQEFGTDQMTFGPKDRGIKHLSYQ